MSDNKYEKILSVSAKLFSRKGYRGTSLQEIADNTGLHKSSLFHYFKAKEELLLRTIEKSVDEVNVNLEKIIGNNRLKPEEKLKKAIENHLFLVIRYIDNVNVYLSEVRSLSNRNRAIYMKKRKKYERDLMKIVAELKTKGYFDGLNLKIVTFGILGMLNSVLKWYRKSGPLNMEEISDIFYKVILNKSNTKLFMINHGIKKVQG